MELKDEKARHRCSECRKWYVAEASASKTQRTCSAACRLERRARQAMARRSAAPGEFRQAERERQRRSRQQKQAIAGPGARMSRAGLSAEAAGVIEEYIEKVRHAELMSRAGLRRRMRLLLAGTTEFSGAPNET